ncbi:Tyrosine recombinase XerD [Microcoleus sp. IPMA8]|uniref:Tyrosine recombinase XerD n=2 Tax=Microcoleus TaxID=44471 RepID=A0ABX2CZH7_9CYAN|nr:Tyrosine recombinase XerD [Microcoleus asticus IPMA8]
MQYLRQTLRCRVGIHACMKIEGHGQAKILTQEEIELLFNKGLQSDRDRALFGICLYTACRIAEACSLKVIDVFTPAGVIRSEMIIRKGNTKGKFGTRTIPIIQELRLLLETYKHPEHPYLFPSRHLNHRWKHANPEAASHLFQEACERVGIIGASTHNLRRSALTQMSNAGIPLRIIQEISGHRNLEQLQKYLEVRAQQVRGAISSLSMLSNTRKRSLPGWQRSASL